MPAGTRYVYSPGRANGTMTSISSPSTLIYIINVCGHFHDLCGRGFRQHKDTTFHPDFFIQTPDKPVKIRKKTE